MPGAVSAEVIGCSKSLRLDGLVKSERRYDVEILKQHRYKAALRVQKKPSGEPEGLKLRFRANVFKEAAQKQTRC